MALMTVELAINFKLIFFNEYNRKDRYLSLNSISILRYYQN